jgi:DNA helicase-2/ATP-dependent DNA helicase PcrA
MATSASFDTFVTTVLNEPQQQAVMHHEGSVLVVAGAGSGKTGVITARITNLIMHGDVHPDQLIALTFTNKAANEMKERIAQFLPEDSQLPFVGTFHAYCLRILKRHASRLPYPFAGILDTDDQQKIIKNILHKNGLQKKLTPKQVSFHISHIKNHNIDPNIASSKQTNSLMHELYLAYEHEKKLSHCLDFDDLLLATLTLFNAPDFAAQFHQRVRHVLVDEYQDTNIVQHALIKAISLHEKKLTIDSLCVVGDEDQSIYSWRGATVTNIRDFVHDFPHTTIIKIEQNYRSVQPILDVANALIMHNPNRTSKKLWSLKKGINCILSLSFASEYQEADSLAQLLLFVQKQGTLASTALLYRAHAQSRALEEALIKESIPYRIIGGIQFYDRMEIKDLLAYLKLIVNPFDRISCTRILNVPSRKLGAKFEELFLTAWEHEPLSTCISVAHMLINQESLTSARSTALISFVAIFDGLSSTTQPSVALEAIIARTRYINHIGETNEKDEADERLSNIDELLNAFKHFEQNGINTIAQALEEIALMQDRSAHTNEASDAVMLMTLHAAKGLEFDTVVLTGLEEGLLPTSRACDSKEGIEEERRLLYVGITRACERLLFSRAKYRYMYGTATHQTPSRFVHEIPPTLVAHHEVGFLRTHEIQALFTQWLGYATTHTSPTQAVVNTSTSSAKISWQINQPVQHIQYGIGVIQTIEQRSNKTYLNVKFKQGIKKIASDFIHSF